MEYAEATGRMVGAARMLAGLDQTELAQLAGISPATVSNVEAGRTEARAATLKAIRKALKKIGITATHDATNGNISVVTNYDPDA